MCSNVTSGPGLSVAVSGMPVFFLNCSQLPDSLFNLSDLNFLKMFLLCLYHVGVNKETISTLLKGFKTRMFVCLRTLTSGLPSAFLPAKL